MYGRDTPTCRHAFTRLDSPLRRRPVCSLLLFFRVCLPPALLAPMLIYRLPWRCTHKHTHTHTHTRTNTHTHLHTHAITRAPARHERAHAHTHTVKSACLCSFYPPPAATQRRDEACDIYSPPRRTALHCIPVYCIYLVDI